MAICIIPARGGSKRIPRKNIKPFRGKPLIGWAIETAKTSGLFDEVYVSTDDAEIADVSASFGARVPWLREAGLADDYTGTTPVVAAAVDALSVGQDTLVCCLYATAIMTQADDLRVGAGLIKKPGQWSFACAQFPCPVERSYVGHKTDTGLTLRARALDHMEMRSQDLPESYYDIGQFYFAYSQTWLTPGARVWDGALGVEYPKHRAVDIDTLADWAWAERLFTPPPRRN